MLTQCRQPVQGSSGTASAAAARGSRLIGTPRPRSWGQSSVTLYALLEWRALKQNENLNLITLQSGIGTASHGIAAGLEWYHSCSMDALISGLTWGNLFGYLSGLQLVYRYYNVWDATTIAVQHHVWRCDTVSIVSSSVCHEIESISSSCSQIGVDHFQ